MGAPQIQTIQVINPVTGKFLTLSQDRVIEWARQQGIDQP
jgi:enhancing lycopene biosynthesis protein 2